VRWCIDDTSLETGKSIWKGLENGPSRKAQPVQRLPVGSKTLSERGWGGGGGGGGGVVFVGVCERGYITFPPPPYMAL